MEISPGAAILRPAQPRGNNAPRSRGNVMSVILGEGEYRYRVEEGWGELPDGWSFHEVGAVGVDRRDNVYVFNRGEHPMIVLDREGNFVRSWGEGQYPRAHG